MPFNIEQAVNVDPIGDYTIKDGINECYFKSKVDCFFKLSYFFYCFVVYRVDLKQINLFVFLCDYF